MPANFIVRRHHRLRDPALHFDARDKGIDEVSARRAAQLGERQQSGGHGPARMDQHVGMRIVEVQHVGGDAVDQGGMQDVRALAASQERRLSSAGKRGQAREHYVDRFMPGAPDRAAGPVDQRADRLVPDFGREMREARIGDVARQPPSLPCGLLSRHGRPFP